MTDKLYQAIYFNPEDPTMGYVLTSANQMGLLTSSYGSNISEFTFMLRNIIKQINTIDINGEVTKEFYDCSIGLPKTNAELDSKPLPLVKIEIVSCEPSKSVKNIKPAKYDKIVDPDDPNNTIDIYRQWFDYELDISLWHNTSAEAYVNCLRLESVISEFIPHFKKHGVSELLYRNLSGPEFNTRYYHANLDKGVVVIRYMVRIERITPVVNKKLSTIEIEATTGDEVLYKNDDFWKDHNPDFIYPTSGKDEELNSTIKQNNVYPSSPQDEVRDIILNNY